METAELCPRLGWDSVYEDSGYLRLEAWFFMCVTLHPSSLIPALDEFHPVALLG